MSCLSSTRRAELLARLAKREASLAIVEATYDELLATSVESYRFDSTEGEQQTKRRGLAGVKDQLDGLQSEIDSLRRKLGGSGIVNMNLRRR